MVKCSLAGTFCVLYIHFLVNGFSARANENRERAEATATVNTNHRQQNQQHHHIWDPDVFVFKLVWCLFSVAFKIYFTQQYERKEKRKPICKLLSKKLSTWKLEERKAKIILIDREKRDETKTKTKKLLHFLTKSREERAWNASSLITLYKYYVYIKGKKERKISIDVYL